MPQPRGAAYAAGIAVTRGDEARGSFAAEDPVRPQLRHGGVEAFDPAQAATQHDDIRVEDVDDMGEGTREVLQRLLRLPDEELQALQAKGVLTLPGTPAA